MRRYRVWVNFPDRASVEAVDRDALRAIRRVREGAPCIHVGTMLIRSEHLSIRGWVVDDTAHLVACGHLLALGSRFPNPDGGPAGSLLEASDD